MLQNIILTSGVLMVLIIVFFIGFFMGVVSALDVVESDNQIGDDLYCFECEIEMPVKEKNGRFYCSNCGSYHGTKI